MAKEYFEGLANVLLAIASFELDSSSGAAFEALEEASSSLQQARDRLEELESELDTEELDLTKLDEEERRTLEFYHLRFAGREGVPNNLDQALGDPDEGSCRAD